MSYTLSVDAGVTGLENLDRLQSTMNSSTRAAEMMDEKLRQITGTNALLTKSLEIQKETLGAVRSQLLLMAEGAERASGGVTRLSGTVRQLGDSSQHAVSQVQAVGGALRTLEGAVPLRAAERFLTLLPGIGTALQAAFPVFGAIAFSEVIGRMISGVVKLEESWRPVLAAQKESNKLLEESVKLVQNQSKALRDAQIENIALTQGPAAAARARAGDLSARAQFGDAERIAELQRERDVLQKIAGGAPAGPFSAQQRFLTQEEVAIARRAGMPFRGPAILNDPTLAPGAEERANANFALNRILEQLNAAQKKQQTDILSAQNERLQAAKDDRKQDRQEDRVDLEMRKLRAAELKHDWEEIEKASKAAARNFDVMIGPLTPGSARFSPSEHFMNELSEAPRISTELTDLERQQREARRLLPELLPDQFLGRPDIEAPAGFVTVQQQLQQMRRQAARRISLQGVQGRLSDNTLQGQQSNIEAQTAMQMAALDREAQVIQDRVLDATKREEALADIESRRYDVALQAEQKMLELAVKQKEQFEQTITGLFEAARQHRVGGFLRGRLDQALDQVIGQVAGVIFDKIKLPGRGPSGVSIPDVLGGALKTATDENTTATDDNTRALKDLTDLLRARAGGGGSIGGARGGGGGWSPSWNGASGPFVLNAFPGAGGGFPGVMMQGLPSSSAGGSNGGWIPGMGGGGGTGGGWGGGGGNSPWDPHTNGGVLSPGGLTSGGAAGIMSKVGIGAASIGAIAAGIHAGGAGGGLETAAGVVGLASLAFPALAPVAMALGVVSSLFSQSRQQRETQIGNQLSAAQFMSPVAINASMSTGGTFADFDRFGDIRSSNLSPFPQIQNGYFVAQRGPTAPGQQTWVPVPGRTLNQFGGPSGGGTMNVTINALDSKSIVDNHASIGDAVARSLLLGSSPHLSETLTARTP